MTRRVHKNPCLCISGCLHMRLRPYHITRERGVHRGCIIAPTKYTPWRYPLQIILHRWQISCQSLSHGDYEKVSNESFHRIQVIKLARITLNHFSILVPRHEGEWYIVVTSIARRVGHRSSIIVARIWNARTITRLVQQRRRAQSLY